MVYSKEVAGILKQHGYRITMPRRAVVRALADADGPLSPYEIQKHLQADGYNIHHVTVYRVLDLLCSLGLAHRVPSSGGFMRCTLGNAAGCHRYMVCRCCGSVAEFADEALCRKEATIAERLGFYVEHHVTEASGLCEHCFTTKGEVR